jgi:hypothetical protein
MGYKYWISSESSEQILGMQNHNLAIDEPLGLDIGHYEEPYSDIY